MEPVLTQQNEGVHNKSNNQQYKQNHNHTQQ